MGRDDHISLDTSILIGTGCLCIHCRVYKAGLFCLQQAGFNFTNWLFCKFCAVPLFCLTYCVCQASLMKTSYEECFYYPILLYQMPVLILRYLPVRVVNVNMSYTSFKKKLIHFFPPSHSGRFCPMEYNTRHTKRRPCFMECWRF